MCPDVRPQANPSTNQKVTFNRVMVNASQLVVGEAETGSEKFSAGGEGEEELVARNAEKSDCQNIELCIREEGLLVTFNMKEVHDKIYTDVEFDAQEISEGRMGLLCNAKKNKKVAFLFQGKVGEAAKVIKR